MLTDEEFLSHVRSAGIGYGRMMQLISAEWADQDARGALTVGPCQYFIDVHGDYHTILDELTELKRSNK